jgi:rifampicin phosphotransferase
MRQAREVPMLRIGELNSSSPPRQAVLFGVGASCGVARGRARVIRTRAELTGVGPTEVVVVDALPTRWVGFLPQCRAVVAQTGGPLQLSARALRARGTPAVVGASGALAQVAHGDEIEVDGYSGIVRVASPGL